MHKCAQTKNLPVRLRIQGYTFEQIDQINLIEHGRAVCQARRPRCEACPLTELCEYYQQTQPVRIESIPGLVDRMRL